MELGRRAGAVVLAATFAFGAARTDGAEEPAAAPEPPAATTQRVIAGRPEYDRSAYFKFHFGEGYRKLWTTPFDATVLGLRTYAGGLTATRRLGHGQTKALALRGKNGVDYTFRPIVKDPVGLLPEELHESFVDQAVELLGAPLTIDYVRLNILARAPDS